MANTSLYKSLFTNTFTNRLLLIVVVMVVVLFLINTVCSSSVNAKYVQNNESNNYKRVKLNNYKLRNYENNKRIIGTSNDNILENTINSNVDELSENEETVLNDNSEHDKEKVITELDNYSINDNSITVNVIGNKVYKKRIIHNNNEIPTFNPSLFTNKDNEIIMILNDNHKDLIIKGNNNPSTILIGKIVSGMVIYIGLNFLFLMIYFVVRIISLIYCEKPIPDFEILL